MKLRLPARTLIALFFWTALPGHAADPLERYVAAPDNAYEWKVRSSENTNGYTLATLAMTSSRDRR